MGINQRKRNRRTALYKQNPYCPFCGIKMILPEEIGFRIVNNKKILNDTPANMCTIEHTQHKGSDLKGLPNSNIICCKKCNNEKQPNK